MRKEKVKRLNKSKPSGVDFRVLQDFYYLRICPQTLSGSGSKRPAARIKLK